ncbi:MAG: hypothetical protein QXK12_04235 [Candidatus Nezhaarchaeales archaeon]
MTERKEKVEWKSIWGEALDKVTVTRVKEHVTSIVIAIVIWIILTILINWVMTIPVPKM